MDSNQQDQYGILMHNDAFSLMCLQRDPAEEALKSNNMNLDQAMSTCFTLTDSPQWSHFNVIYG